MKPNKYIAPINLGLGIFNVTMGFLNHSVFSLLLGAFCLGAAYMSHQNRDKTLPE
jgi:hypothetical protein